MEERKTFEEAKRRSGELMEEIKKSPSSFRILTGDRPTGRLHIGHYFGSLAARVELSRMGVPTMIVIADYQVLTDRDAYDKISENTAELVSDYLAAGIEVGDNVSIFAHSYVPEANQLLLAFLTLVTNAELSRNPTVKEEIKASSLQNINAAMYIYPVHQAVDILFCKASVVPVGKDQLPHIELTRSIARRFNEKFCKNLPPIFPEPLALLSRTPSILGLDGSKKMSKSLGNTIMLSNTAEETAALVKKAKTDSIREITFDKENRPEVANLLTLLSLCTGESEEEWAARIGDKGSGELKRLLSEALNEKFKPLREKRAKIRADKLYIKEVLESGARKARKIAEKTLYEVRCAMNMLQG